MDILTKKSETSDMVWFIDHDNTDMLLEPCEMSISHVRLVLQKLSDYEKSVDLELTNTREFQREDFTETEFKLLKLAFKLMDDIVDVQHRGNPYMCNELFHLTQKLGICDLIY